MSSILNVRFLIRLNGQSAAELGRDAAVAAVLAALDMATERGRAAGLDRRHHLELARLTWPACSARQAGP